MVFFPNEAKSVKDYHTHTAVIVEGKETNKNSPPKQ